jgi:hypothetical protein
MRRGRARTRTTNEPKLRSLSAVVQIRDMAEKFPDCTARRRGNEAIWEGHFRPIKACATYLVRIEALSGQRPRVRVLEPKLQIPPERYQETHCFSDGSLCLHLHEQWTPDKYVADTIVPWIPLWLINYEYWLATDQWLGGGQHPGR